MCYRAKQHTAHAKKSPQAKRNAYGPALYLMSPPGDRRGPRGGCCGGSRGLAEPLLAVGACAWAAHTVRATYGRLEIELIGGLHDSLERLEDAVGGHA